MRPDKSLTPFEIRLYKHYRVVHGCRIALAFVLTFVLVRLLDVPEGTWPLITLVVVMGPISFWGNVVPRAFERIGGTVLGSALGLIALKLELISFPVMLAWCGAAMFLCGWLALGKKPYQALLIGITLAVVVGAPAGDMTTALWRSGDVILGSLLAMLFTGICRSGLFCTGVFRWLTTLPPLTAFIRPAFPLIWSSARGWKSTCKPSLTTWLKCAA